MIKTILRLPATIFLVALAAIGGAVLSRHSLLLGLRWFSDWLPAALIAASTYTFVRQWGNTGVTPDASSSARNNMSRLVIIAIISLLFTMTYRYFLQPFALKALTPGAKMEFISSLTDKSDDVTDSTPLPYTAPVQEHVPTALENAVAGDLADGSTTAVIPEYLQDSTDPDQSAYTRSNLLRAAQDAYLQKRWFDAHYYAKNALTQIPADSTDSDSRSNRKEMEQIAEDAWTRISRTETFINEEARSFFLKKREGYSDLLENKILSAYGIFSELKINSPNDPDVNRYFDVAMQKVKASYYFTDEVAVFTEGKPQKENRVYFTLPRPDGGYSLFFAKNLMTVKSAKGAVCYVRDLSFTVYGPGGRLDYSFNTPYAKVIPVPSAGVDAEQRRRFSLTKTGEVLLVMLDGVDRNNGHIIFEPHYTPDAAFTEAPPLEINRYLDFGLSTLLQLSAAEGGPEQMSLPSLWQFVFKGGQFGFPAETYFITLLDHICLPFLFLLILFLFAMTALKYGLGESSHGLLRGVLLITLVTALAYAALTLLTLVSHLFAFALFSALGPIPILFIMIACNLAALGICAALFSRTG